MGWAATAAIAGMVGAGVGAAGAIQQGKAAKQSAEFNAAMMKREADREKQIGELNARRVRKETESLAATQRALLAGGGGDQSTGSALLIQEDLAEEGEFNARLAEVNAETAVSTKMAQATLARMGGRAAGTSSYIRAGTTLLSGAFNVAKEFK